MGQDWAIDVMHPIMKHTSESSRARKAPNECLPRLYSNISSVHMLFSSIEKVSLDERGHIRAVDRQYNITITNTTGQFCWAEGNQDVDLCSYHYSGIAERGLVPGCLSALDNSHKGTRTKGQLAYREIQSLASSYPRPTHPPR